MLPGQIWSIPEAAQEKKNTGLVPVAVDLTNEL